MARRPCGDADRIARGVAESLLVKTALFGRGPQLGDASSAPWELPEWTSTWSALSSSSATSAWLRAAAPPSTTSPPRVPRWMKIPCGFRVRMHDGEASGWIWTCDLSHGYVDINASYRS